jgi:hypothetical protein
MLRVQRSEWLKADLVQRLPDGLWKGSGAQYSDRWLSRAGVIAAPSRTGKIGISVNQGVRFPRFGGGKLQLVLCSVQDSRALSYCKS